MSRFILWVKRFFARSELPFKTGDRVKIVHGAFTDVEAVVAGFQGRNLLLDLDLHGNAGQTEMPRSQIERLD